MHITHRTTGIVMSIVISVLLTSAISVLAGTLDATTVPSATSSYTLEDIYNRLDNGTAGTTSSFTEPIAGPVSGTKHTLSEIMAKAPAVDDVNGAAVGDVLLGKTFWGRTSNGWGPLTGISGSGGSAPVPRTGQTPTVPLDVTAIVGADGNLQKGLVWPSARFTSNSANTVTDNLTGLMWAKNANIDGVKSWAAALTYCNGLTIDSLSGWRLPNYFELVSLLDLAYSNPALSNDAGIGKWVSGSGSSFTGVQSDYYWSSSTLAGSTGNAWFVSLGGGLVDVDDKTFLHCVWPVRGGQ